MNKKSINFSMLAVVAAMSLYLFGFSAASQAEEAIARVIVSSGHFTAVQPGGKERVLKRRSAIFEGDTLVTAKDGRAQIRFKDGALIDIQAATQLRLDEYNYQGKVDGTEKNTMSLIKGGFRTITGVVGKKNKKNYKVNTPVATIGIRGTHYGLHYCGGDCGVDTGDGQYQNKKGLYGGVVDGAVVANNDSGEIRLGNDEYFHVASSSAEPQILLVPPAIIFEGSESQTTVTPVEDSQSVTETTTEETVVPDSYDVAYSDPDTGAITTSFQEPIEPVVAIPTQEPIGDTPPNQILDETTLNTWPNGVVGGIAFNDTGALKPISGLLYGKETSVALNSDGDPILFYHVDSDQNKYTFKVTGGVNATADFRDDTTGAATGTTWGRWDTGKYVVTENGNIVTTGSSFHFIYSNNVTSNARLSELAATYGDVDINYSSNNSDGVIKGTDNNDATITGSMTASANYVSQTITSLSYGFSNGVETFSSGTSDMPVKLADAALGISINGTCSGTLCSTDPITTGTVNLIPVGNDADAMMTTFDIGTEKGSISISGVGLLTQ